MSEYGDDTQRRFNVIVHSVTVYVSTHFDDAYVVHYEIENEGNVKLYVEIYSRDHNLISQQVYS